MSTIYLIRHGKTEANKRHLYYGSTDLPLCEEGVNELTTLRKLYPQTEHYHFITSGMKRTEQTLHLLFGAVPHTQDLRFREMDFGSFEMKSYDQLKDQASYRMWLTGDHEANLVPGGESGVQMRKRVLTAFAEVHHAGHDLVIICHGGPIAAIMAHLFPEENKNRYDWQPGYGCGYELTCEVEKWNYRRIENPEGK